MTEYRSTHVSGHKLRWDPEEGRVSIQPFSNGLAYFVQLSEIDRRNLAFELLEKEYEVKESFRNPGDYVLKRRLPEVEVGEYYRVKSQPNMMPEFKLNPIVKVAEIQPGREGRIILELEDGSRHSWTRLGMLNLTGPIKAEERKVWIEINEGGC